MYNELFESIIRTSGENTDDIYSEKDDFWAPVPVIEQMFERVLREMGQEYVNNDADINDYKNERIGQYKDPRFDGTLNNPNQSKEEFEKEIEGEVKLARDPNGNFKIIRVFDDKSRETIGYITYEKIASDLIINVTIARTAANFIKKKGGVSVIDEMEKFILKSFKEGIETIHWTCYENNPIKEVYDKRFKNYKYKNEISYDSNYKQNIIAYFIYKSSLS